MILLQGDFRSRKCKRIATEQPEIRASSLFLAVLYMIIIASLIRWCHTEMTGHGVRRAACQLTPNHLRIPLVMLLVYRLEGTG